MPNYKVSAEDWTDLSTLMGDDYDATKDYSLYVNQISLGLLQIDTGSSKPTAMGKLLPLYATEAIGVGAGSTFWLTATASPVDVYIFENASA